MHTRCPSRSSTSSCWACTRLYILTPKTCTIAETALHTGLIGWVPNTDTLHQLIREFRDARKTPLNIEHRLMLGMSPDYDHLPLIHKVEVFQHALDSTDGEIPI